MSSISWIKMQTDLERQGEVALLSSRCNRDTLWVVGALHAVWSAADSATADGMLRGYSLARIDQLVRAEGFGAAMVEAGWLIDHGAQGLEIPNFTRHNGHSAKARAQGASRQARSRAQDGKALLLSRTQRDNSVTREEKRREEEEKGVYTREAIQPSPETGGPPPSDDVTLSPVQRWIANTLPGIGSAYPANRRTGGPETVRAIADALDAIVGNPDRWPEAQVNPRGWLHERIKAFAASPVAQTQYCPSLKKWLAEEWWANEALWQVAEKTNGKAPNPSTRRLTAEELIARNRKRSPA